MLLGIYELRNPKTGETEQVYEFPEEAFFYQHAITSDDQVLVSNTPLQWPVRLVNKTYLTKKENQGVIVDVGCNMELAYPPEDAPVSEAVQFNRYLAKIIIQLIAPLSVGKQRLDDLKDFGAFVKSCFIKKVPWSYVKDIVEKYYESGKFTFAELTTAFPCEVLSDLSELEALCDTILKENPKSVEDYKKGKTNSINHLKGQAMKMTKGKADTRLVTEILEKKLKA